MSVIPVIQAADLEGRIQLGEIKKRLSLEPLFLNNSGATNSVRQIIYDVRRRGDQAVVDYTAKFDQIELKPQMLAVSEKQITAAVKNSSPKFLAALDKAIANVRRYQKAMLPPEPSPIKPDGAASGSKASLAVRYVPLDRVGVYVPGGAAAYPSTVVMTVVPAQVAGVKNICLCSPMRGGSVSYAVLAAAGRLGVREVYAVGGAQAIAAMAFGTESIPRVDKIVGPGNLYVQLAKKELFGVVDIDSFAGPSEVVVLADDSASPAVVAAELLAQAEHAPGSCILITASQTLAQKVQAEVDWQITKLSRQHLTVEALKFASAIVVTADKESAISEVNALAPEHLQICTRSARQDAKKITNAGAIFIGPFTPVAAGDYVAGPSHVLPTSGTARFFSGLSAENFRKRISIVELDESSLDKLSSTIAELAKTEGFDAHARSVEIRREQKSKGKKG
ncbi:MAG TPA: histidinol dehydrogenase [Phycisphaerae bacterium]|nr:histidinol dehydrogenase [Phycisphaerae bacterium]